MLVDFFFIFLFFSLLDGSCLLFHHELQQNHCSSIYSHTEGGRMCFRCYINMVNTQIDAIHLNKSCSPVPNNHCVDLHFNTTDLFREYSRQYANLTNQLFAPSDEGNHATVNSLHIHIKYDTHRSFSFDNFRAFDQIENRQYHAIAFLLQNRHDQITLPLDDDIHNMSLEILQINIYCGSKGFYQYNYRVDDHNQSLMKSLTCTLPTTTTISTSTTMLLLSSSSHTTTRSGKIRVRSIVFYSLIGSGSLIPCLLLACCLYFLCKHKEIEQPENSDPRDSLTESISNDSDQHVTF